MESPAITFELHWKRKLSSNRGDSIGTIGLYIDNTLDWMTFKSYLCQTQGTSDDVTVSYIDSEGDEIPIESEIEFQEALKFARQQAVTGQAIVLRLDKKADTSSSETVADTADTTLLGATAKLLKFEPRGSHKLKSSVLSSEKLRSLKNRTISDDRKPKPKKNYTMASLGSGLVKDDLCKDDSPPVWFKKYMQKIKSEIVAEVTANVLHSTRQLIESEKWGCSQTIPHCCTDFKNCTMCSKVKKKRNTDDDSSDTSLTNEMRDHKLLKKIEKLHRREKKLEKKLDSKLEKLENKTKRLMEKKSHPKSKCESTLLSDKKNSEKKCLKDGPVKTCLMDCLTLNDAQSEESHVKVGQSFTKTWDIMNTGTVPWNDKTELRLAFNSILEPEESTVKCPPLQPGEKGQISVAFRPSDVSGTFETYWHFYHMGIRFGPWISCIAVIDENDDKMNGNVPSSKVTDGESSSISTININKELDEIPVKEKSTEHHDHCDPEYESDSDSGNLSVISATQSFSDSDDNFVVVPMPACFMLNMPADSDDKIPVVVKSSKKKFKNILTKPEDVDSENCKEKNDSLSINTNSDTNSELWHPNITVKVESDRVFSQGMREAYNDSNLSENQNKCDLTSDYGKSIVKPLEVLSKNGMVFAVDKDGCSFPMLDEAECLKAETNLQNVQADQIKTSHNPKGLDQARRLERKESDGRNDLKKNCNNASGIAAPKPVKLVDKNKDVFAVDQHGHSFPVKVIHQNTPNNSDSNSVDILHGPLVVGAVNVASTAIKTAKEVISNLRWKTSENSERQEAPTEEPSCSLEQSVQTLVEMGFTNRNLNILLLERYNHNISKVVGELLSHKYPNIDNID